MVQKYIPILKWKKGEQTALKNLSSANKQLIIPLIELTDMVEPPEFIQTLKSIYVYPIYLDTTITAENDVDYLNSIIEESNKSMVEIYPVLNYDNLNNELLYKSTDRLAIKVGIPEDIEGPSYPEIFDSIKELKINYPNLKIDIILNLGLILDKNTANNQYRDLKNIISTYMEHDNFYNSIIICSTSFPEDLSSYNAGDQVSFKRFDFMIYKKTFSSFPMLMDKMLYCDYGVTKFTDSEIDFSLMKYGILPKLKYTCNNEYLFWKGKRKKVNSVSTLEIGYFELAENLINSSYYYGEDFSFGDKEIKERYNKALKKCDKKCGNGTTWVTISANHHICAVIEQLSNLS